MKNEESKDEKKADKKKEEEEVSDEESSSKSSKEKSTKEDNENPLKSIFANAGGPNMFFLTSLLGLYLLYHMLYSKNP